MRLVKEKALLARIQKVLPEGQSLHKSRRDGRFYIVGLNEPIDDLETYARSLGALRSDEELEPTTEW